MPLSRRSLLLAAGSAAVLGSLSTSAQADTLPRLVPQGDSVPVEHLIIGTGYGGAVAAYRLAMAGHRVRMLEMGKRWNTPGPDGKIHPPMLNPDWRAMWYSRRTKMPLSRFLGIDVNKDIGYGPGVLDRRTVGETDIFLGRGVGGGSLVNGGMAPRPRREVLSRQLPSVDVDEFFDVYLPRAEQQLRINVIDPSFRESTPWYQFARTGRNDAEACGYNVVDVPNNYDFDYMRREASGQAPASALAGEVIYGNNHGKRDLTKTYLGLAEATGRVQIDVMTEALTIRPMGGGYVVDTQVRNFDGSIASRPQYAAQRIYLGAGAVGTAEILLRSRYAGYLTNLATAVGAGWGPNGNTMFARQNGLFHPTGSRQSTIPIMGVDNWDSGASCFTEIAPMPAGADLFMQLYLCIGDNPNSANFGFDANGLTLDWDPGMLDPSVERAEATFSDLNRRFLTTFRSDLFGTGDPFSRNFTYHPLGGAVLNQATDNVGRLLGYEGIYVTDGSLIPHIIGVNPYLTITALAERLMDDILARGK